MQLLTNVPPAEEGGTEWGWGASLPSNANEVPPRLLGCLLHMATSSSQSCRWQDLQPVHACMHWYPQGRWHGGGPSGAAGPLKSALQKNVRLCRGHSAIR